MHWYTVEGKPCHTQPKVKGGERATTITDARKLNLVPSVTTVLGVFAKPSLTSWMIWDAINTCVDNPMFGSEDKAAYNKRIQSLRAENGDKITGFGTTIHDAIEKALSGAMDWNVPITTPEGQTYELAEYVNPVLELFNDNGWRPLELETTLVGDGYAGTADVVYVADNEYGIIDFKTTGDATKDEKYLVQPEYKAQIALYHLAEHGGIDDKAAGYNIFISRDTNVGAVKAVRYDAEELRKWAKSGLRAVKEWQLRNDYIPNQEF